jgi:hypothetical protein
VKKAYLAYYHGWKEGPAVRLQFEPFETHCHIEASRPKIIIGFLDWVLRCRYSNDKSELRHWGGHLSNEWKNRDGNGEKK